MKIELLNYAFENEGTRQVWADLSVMVDGVNVRWHMIPSEWDEQQGWVTSSSGIGAPIDEYDLSDLSDLERSLLLGERHGHEEILEFEERVESALQQDMKAIAGELGALFLRALEREERHGY